MDHKRAKIGRVSKKKEKEKKKMKSKKKEDWSCGSINNKIKNQEDRKDISAYKEFETRPRVALCFRSR